MQFTSKSHASLIKRYHVKIIEVYETSRARNVEAVTLQDIWVECQTLWLWKASLVTLTSHFVATARVSELWNLIALGSVLKSEEFFSYNKNSKLLNLIPFHRAFGMIAVLSVSLRKGSTLISVPRFDENLCFHLLQYYKVCIQSSTKPLRG